MTALARARLAVMAVVAVVALVATAACVQAESGAPPITASVLVEPSAGDARWFRDVRVPKGTDGYELLDAATGGEINAEWFPEFRSHFVTGVLGVAPEGAQFWSVFVWNEANGGWEPLPVGADLFSVKDGHVMGWALVEYDPDTPQLPIATP